jgi:hypothetical protein
MGRIRTIKPEFTQDEELSSLSAEVHLLAAGLLCHSDDDGYFNANPKLVKAAVFPLRESSLSIHDMLTQLVNIGFIRLGTATDAKHYGHVVKFTEHQRVNRPTPSKIKHLPIQWVDSVSTHGRLSEDSLPERKGKEGKGINPSSEQNGCSDQERTSSKTKKREPTAEAVRLATLLKEEISRNKPDFKFDDGQERSWAITADRMLRLDSRKPEQVAELIRWVQRDEFWMSNVLSMDTLRGKFDQLQLKRKHANGNGKAAPVKAPTGNALDYHNRLMKEAEKPGVI